MYSLAEVSVLSIFAPKTTYLHVSPTAMQELSDANRRSTMMLEALRLLRAVLVSWNRP